MIINSTNDGERLYKVALNTGLAWVQQYEVYANNEQEAIDTLADYLEENELTGLYTTHYDIADECEIGQTVDEYAEANGLICCGNHGIYIRVEYMEVLK